MQNLMTGKYRKFPSRRTNNADLWLIFYFVVIRKTFVESDSGRQDTHMAIIQWTLFYQLSIQVTFYFKTWSDHVYYIYAIEYHSCIPSAIIWCFYVSTNAVTPCACACVCLCVCLCILIHECMLKYIINMQFLPRTYTFWPLLVLSFYMLHCNVPLHTIQ